MPNIRPSALVDVDACDYLYYLRWEFRSETTGEVGLRHKDHHTEFGTMLHYAIQTFYALRKRRGFETAVMVATKVLLRRSFGYEGAPPKDRYTLLRTFIYYTEYYRDEASEVTVYAGRRIIEYRYEYDTGIKTEDGEPWYISMQVDRLMTFQGGIGIFDIKTTKFSLDDKYFMQWERSQQMYSYFLGGSALPIPPSFIVVDGVQILVNDSRFSRRIIPISDAQVNDWAHEKLSEMLKAVERGRKTGVWPQRFASCMTRYGPCRFWDHCKQDALSRKEVLESISHGEDNNEPS